MRAPAKKKIGEILLEAGLITQEQLDKAVERQKIAKTKLETILVDLGYVDETIMLNKLAEQLQVPFIELKHYEVKAEIIKMLPEAIARRNKAIILSKIGSGYLVGMSDPSNLVALDEVSRRVKGTLRPALVRESDLLRIIDQFYRNKNELVSFASELADELDPTGLEEDATDEGA
ncbi:MAG: MSHA biogenesis protein MshE, partial [Pseudomonadota bacterium]